MQQIQFYIDRDGEDSARESIRMQLAVSIRSLINPQVHASTREYRKRFVDDAKEMARFIKNDEACNILKEVLAKAEEKLAKLGAKDAALHAPFIAQLRDAISVTPNFAHGVISKLSQHPLDDAKPVTVAQRQFVVAEADYARVAKMLAEANISFSDK